MVADEDENEILVPVALHEGDQCVQEYSIDRP